jgi:uncharacterized protein (DUF1778 family)
MYGHMPYILIESGGDTMGQTISVPTKTARLETRVTPEQKRLFQRAADLTGRSLTDFILNSAQEVAARTVREHDVLTVSGQDRELFVSALLHPPAPSRRLRQAAGRYKRALGR